MFVPTWGDTIRLYEAIFVNPQEKRMKKTAIRLLTLAIFAAASFVAPMTAPAKAATDGITTKKKHKKINPAGAQAPAASSQYPRNMSEDPDRKVGGGY
jgi:hypothetical protein